MKVLFFYHPLFLEHNPGKGHPERKERLLAILDKIKSSGLNQKLEFMELGEAGENLISLVHDREYIKRVMLTKGSSFAFDADTITSPESADAARTAVGAVIQAIEEVFDNENTTAFCAVRPPGHHAEKNRAMGFCFFNNVAIGAEYAIKEMKLKKVLIFDPDLHHGNGTQNAFYDRDDVFYISFHRYPYYPGTGHFKERGTGKGEDYTLNFPLPGGMGDDEYIYLARESIVRLIGQFCPELVLFSAGFDAHLDDPLGDMRVTSQGFRDMYVEIVSELNRHKIPFVFVLEGGYSLTGLSESVFLILKSLLNDDVAVSRSIKPHSFVVELIKTLLRKG